MIKANPWAEARVRSSIDSDRGKGRGLGRDTAAS